MNSKNELEDTLEFLSSYPSGQETIILPSGKEVNVKKYFLKFKPWQGEPINTYGGKAVIDFNGQPEYAETAVLKLFKQNGWDGVWVDKKLYRTGILGNDTVKLPDDKHEILDQIRTNISGSGGCWDLFLWKDGQITFVELKKSKEDKVRSSQIGWLEESIKFGFNSSNYIFVEWNITGI